MTRGSERPALDLDELERLAAAATPTNDRRFALKGRLGEGQVVSAWSAMKQADADLAYIAAVNPETVIALCARVRELQAERDDLLVWAVELKGDALRQSDPVERAMTHFHKTDAGLLREKLAKVEDERDAAIARAEAAATRNGLRMVRSEISGAWWVSESTPPSPAWTP